MPGDLSHFMRNYSHDKAWARGYHSYNMAWSIDHSELCGSPGHLAVAAHTYHMVYGQ